ncbi:MAG TPA: hypothetical protein PLF40_03335 [Kofleriaceae bacterium]|nr:hypothetical protein [Kofleriaceae bacterium]
MIGFLMITFAIVVGAIKLGCLMGANDLGVHLGSMSSPLRLVGVGVSAVQLGAGLAWVRERKVTAMRWTIIYACVAIGHTFMVWLWASHVQLPDGGTGGNGPADCNPLGCLLANSFELSQSAIREIDNRLLMMAGVASGLWPLLLLCCHRLWRTTSF